MYKESYFSRFPEKCSTTDTMSNKYGAFTLFLTKQNRIWLRNTIIIYLFFFSDFWEVLNSLNDELQKKFLLFATGSDRVPVGGMGEMTFKITKVNHKPDNLPEAHTCFNQLVLPDYPTQEILRQKLIIAISNAEGFGLEWSFKSIHINLNKLIFLFIKRK